MSSPTFSLCHATARLPNGWRAAYEAWKANADDWSKVEYVLAVDRRPFYADVEAHAAMYEMMQEQYPEVLICINEERECAVDAWNTAGSIATGRFLITAADDMFPPPHWDTELLKVIPSLDGEYMIEVKSGTSPADDEWMRVQLHSFITRPYYERIGNFFYPEYVGYYADVDATEMARMHGVMIDARHLTFQHRHWIGTNVPQDEVYMRQASDANTQLGMSILGSRRANGFKGENRAGNR